MLALTRRVGETIAIGGEVVVTVLEIGGGRVRLGVQAPRTLPVYRGEIVSRIERENREAVAAKHAPDPLEAHALSFPEGIYGFPTHRSFVVCELAEPSGCRALVSRTDPTIQLLVADACLVWPGYPTGDARAAAGLPDEEVAVAAVVTAPADGSPATVNLLAPIVIGLKSRRGAQVILDRPDLGLRHVLPSRLAPRACA